MRIHPGRERGFTLIELMVVVVVFGILAAIAIPSVTGYMKTTRLLGAAATLENDLRYARSLSTAQRRTFQVLFTSNQYTVAQVSPATTLLTRPLPRGVTCSATDTATFYAWGLTDPITVTVTAGSNSKVMHLATNGKVTRD